MTHTGNTLCQCFESWLKKEKTTLFKFCSWGVKKQVAFDDLVIEKQFCKGSQLYKDYKVIVEMRIKTLMKRPIQSDPLPPEIIKKPDNINFVITRDIKDDNGT